MIIVEHAKFASGKVTDLRLTGRDHPMAARGGFGLGAPYDELAPRMMSSPMSVPQATMQSRAGAAGNTKTSPDATDWECKA